MVFLPMIGSILAANATLGIASSTISFLFFSLPWGPSRGAKVMTAVMFWCYVGLSYLLSRKLPAKFIDYQALDGKAFPSNLLRDMYLIKAFVILVLFHTIQSLLLIGVLSREDGRSLLQTGLWPLKAILALFALGMVHFIPLWFTSFIHLLSLAGAFFFIIFQMIILIDLACTSAEYLVQKYDESDEDPTYKWILIGLSAFFALITFSGSLYVMSFEKTGEVVAGIFNIILAVAMVVSSLLEKVQQAQAGVGIFPAFLISGFNTYLITSAACDDQSIKDNISPWIRKLTSYIGGFVAFSTLFFMTSEKATDEEVSETAAAAPATDASGEDDQEDPREGVYNYSRFHLVFVLAAFYLMRVFTDWKGLATDLDDDDNPVELFMESVWPFRVKVGTMFLLSGLYLWVLFAPLVLNDDSDGFFA